MHPSAPRRSSPRPPGARRLLYLLPLLFLLLAVLHLARREPLDSPRTPGVSSPEERIAAFTGELESAAGGWLSATLTPLHADPRRQAFERQSMAQRLDLAPGEPWRLTLRWEAARAEAAGAARPSASLGASGSPAGEGPGRIAPAGIRLGAVGIRDDDGLALESLPARATREGDLVPPLQALLAPPQGALRPGQSADWILWGRAPGAGARLVGLIPDDDPTFLSATGFTGPFELRATLVRRGDLAQPLARLEREDAGKSEAPGASERGDGSRSEDGL